MLVLDMKGNNRLESRLWYETMKEYGQQTRNVLFTCFIYLFWEEVNHVKRIFLVC